MQDPFYPALQEPALLQLRVAMQQLAAHPGYLTNEKCPYSPSTVEFMQQLATPAAVTERADRTFDGEADKLEFVETEVIATLDELNELVRALGRGENSERLQILKAKAGLVEKLVSYREKIWSMREMAEFQARIIDFLEAECSKEQVQALKESLRGLKSVEQGGSI